MKSNTACCSVAHTFLVPSGRPVAVHWLSVVGFRSQLPVPWSADRLDGPVVKRPYRGRTVGGLVACLMTSGFLESVLTLVYQVSIYSEMVRLLV